MNNHNGIEGVLFDVQGGWNNDTSQFGENDEFEEASLVFYNATSKVPIGDFPVGTKFFAAVFYFDMCRVDLYADNTDEPIGSFRLNISIGETVQDEGKEEKYENYYDPNYFWR